ncbi:replication protein [Kurthia gibsonii]|uniref:phage replisome organizer N-terminal domain-containing protein n=1 Tax=Kurthia gibsonii TaxID=33946 RepID=UPI000EB174DD|nr:phage replisome organizer N-terminal domain-containing protein [Kurthia gibsonii]RXH52452.1 replication protein [Kurthia gibsonii]
MAEITWIKLKTDMFEHDKIRLIESLPDSDTIIVIWVKLLAAAGKANSNGFIMLSENIPMNEEEMATIFNRPLNTVRLALQTFKRYGMIEVDGEAIRIKNWENHQNIDGMDRVKQLNAERNRKYRERKKQAALPQPESDVSVTSRDGADIDKELDIDKIKKKKRKEEDKELSCKHDSAYKEIIDYLNLKAGTAYRSTSKATQSLIKARLNESFSIEDFKTVIDKKVFSWLQDPNFSKYLRPSTLFGTKFEGYLNERVRGYESNSTSHAAEYSDGINF